MSDPDVFLPLDEIDPPSGGGSVGDLEERKGDVVPDDVIFPSIDPSGNGSDFFLKKVDPAREEEEEFTDEFGSDRARYAIPQEQMKDEFDAYMKKLDADPHYKNASLEAKRKTASIALQVRFEMLRTQARVKDINARRAAGKEKKKVSVEEALFGEEEEEEEKLSKRQKRKNKKRADALPATMPHLPTIEKTLVDHANPAPQERVKTKGEKKHGRRYVEKQTEQELYLKRMQEWDHHTKQWIIRERATYLRLHPNASEAEAEAKVTLEHARKFVTWDKICSMFTIADIQDWGKLTPAQHKEATKIKAKREEESKAEQEEKQRAAIEALPPEKRAKKAIQERNLQRLHVEWVRLNTQQHQNRRELRLYMAQQMLLQRSIEWHHRLMNAFQFGVPMRSRVGDATLYLHREGGNKITPERGEAKKDEDGQPELARRAPMEQAYIEFTVEEESLHQFSADYNPLLRHRIIGQSELEARLDYIEKTLLTMHREDPTDRKGQVAHLQGEEESCRNLLREVKTVNMHTHFVMCIKVECDAIPVLRGMGARESRERWCKVIYSECTYDMAAQDNRVEINALGPIKTPLRLCGYDGAYCLDGTPIKTEGKILPLHQHAQCTIKTCSKPECAEAGEPDEHNKKRPPVFCSDVCKRRHVEAVHDHTAVARRAKANKIKKQNRRARQLAAIAADAAAELARQDPDEIEIAEAICAREAITRKAELAEQNAILGVEDEEEERESEADEEIEV